MIAPMHWTPPRIFPAAFVLLAAAGCQAPPQPAGPTSIVLRIPDYEAFFDSALTLLREHDFQPRLADRVAGLAVTHPSTGAQWFEFWRGDSRGGYQLLESSLHTIRRTVRLSIQPEVELEPQPRSQPQPATRPQGEAGGTDRYRVTVEVQKERFCSPQRQVTTASGALQIYSERLPTEEGLRASRVRGEHWVSLGRDPLLEEYLLGRLRAVRPDVQSAAPDGDRAVEEAASRPAGEKPLTGEGPSNGP